MADTTATGKNLTNAVEKTVHVAEVKRWGEQIIIPATMDIDVALDVIKRRRDYEMQSVAVSRVFEAFVWDGAQALAKAIEKKYGWAQGVDVYTFFGKEPPTIMQIEVSLGKFRSVPWGRFRIPNVTGFVETTVEKKNGRFFFKLGGEILRKHEGEIQDLCDLTAKFLREESIYKGQPFKIRFRRDDGKVLEMPEPRYLDLSGVKPEELVFSDDVQDAIETNVFTPLRYMRECLQHRIPFKRGVLLTSEFGTGKTLVAMNTADIAADNDITFIYCTNALEFAETVEFGKTYQPAVVFCEDIDRILEGERDMNMDHILNVIDGIDAKNASIMVVLTTNSPHKIHPAMLRPGRLDAVINLKKPDEKAVERLIRLYGRGLVPENEDLTEVGKTLKGNIPAVIREAVERSKLAAIRRSQGKSMTLTSGALVEAAKTMQMQLELLNPVIEREPSDIERAAYVIRDTFRSNGQEKEEKEETKLAA